MCKQYHNERTLNPYLFKYSAKPKIIAIVCVSICATWIFFYSVQMNAVHGNSACFASLEAKTNFWLQTANYPTGDMSKYVNVGYKLRLMCVLGVTIWSQIALLALI